MSNLKKRIDVRYILTLAASILIALAIGGVLMMLTGFNPFEAYGAMIELSLIHICSTERSAAIRAITAAAAGADRHRFASSFF